MFSKLFKTGVAAKLGVALAEGLSQGTAAGSATRAKPASRAQAVELQRLVQRVDQEARPLKLGWIGRARLVNSFKWKLRESGFAPDVAEELSHIVLSRLLGVSPVDGSPGDAPIPLNRAMRRRFAKKR